MGRNQDTIDMLTDLYMADLDEGDNDTVAELEEAFEDNGTLIEQEFQLLRRLWREYCV